MGSASSAGGHLLSGPAFDEAESHASFAAALQSWRQGSAATVANSDREGSAPTGRTAMWTAADSVASACSEIQTDLTVCET